MPAIEAREREPKSSGLYLSVNVSARQFHQTNFVDKVKQNIASYDVNPKLLKLELTETVVLDNVEEVVSRMKQLTNVEVSFALNDFGT